MKHVVVGLALVMMGLWGMVAWWDSFGFVMRGLVPVALLGLGIVATLSGYYRLSGSPRDEYDYEEDDAPRSRRGSPRV